VPIYEYRCDACKEQFEEYLSLSTSPAPPCPACGKTTVTRVLSMFATEWLPGDVAWHKMPGKWDLPGGDTSRPSAAISKAIPPAAKPKKKPA
jgi:putative FmdB family regulatory protein